MKHKSEEQFKAVTLTQAFKTLSWFDHFIGVILIIGGTINAYLISDSIISSAMALSLIIVWYYGGLTFVRRKIMQRNGSKWV